MDHLLITAATGDLAELSQLLEHEGQLINGTDEEQGWTPLMAAAMACQSGAVDLLLRLGAEVNVRDRYGSTALIFACEKGWGNLVETLLRSGAEVDVLSSGGQTPLIAATRSGHMLVVRQLLEAIHTGCQSPASKSASCRKVGEHDSLESGGGDQALVASMARCEGWRRRGSGAVNVRGKGGATALWWAACGGRAGILKLLLEEGMSDWTVADDRGLCPRMVAEAEGHEECLQVIEVGHVVRQVDCPLPI